MSKRKFLGLTVVAVLALAAGCAENTAENADGTTMLSTSGDSAESKNKDASVSAQNLQIKDVDSTNVNLDSFDGKDWIATVDGSVVRYESAGSGSCKPIIESAMLSGETLTLTRPDYTGKPCTMDLQRFAQEISFQDGGAFPDNLKIVVVDPAMEALASGEVVVSGEFQIEDLPGDVETAFPDGQDFTVAVSDGAITYIAGGSGGCPPIISSVADSNGTISLVRKDWGNGDCEESYVVVKQRIVRVDGAAIPDDAKIEVETPEQ